MSRHAVTRTGDFNGGFRRVRLCGFSHGIPMRLSAYYRLGRTQPSLDCVDIDVTGDVRVFVYPRALRLVPSAWADECVSLIQSFFRTLIAGIQADDDDRVQSLLGVLREPNETHLGHSSGRARGHGLGGGD